MKVLQTLLDHGADLNARTKVTGRGATGGSPLWWALQFYDEDHMVPKLLKSHGGKNIAPHAKDEL
jgi:hypothetical protein